MLSKVAKGSYRLSRWPGWNFMRTSMDLHLVGIERDVVVVANQQAINRQNDMLM